MGDAAFRNEDMRERKVVTLSPLVKGFAGVAGQQHGRDGTPPWGRGAIGSVWAGSSGRNRAW